MSLTLCIRPGGSSAEVRIEGEIDISEARRLPELLLWITHTYGPRLLLDLSAVSFLDCAGLRALLLTRRHAEQRGWSVHITTASPIVVKIITLTGAEDALPVRNQGRNSGSGSSSQPEGGKCCPADPPGGNGAFRRDADRRRR